MILHNSSVPFLFHIMYQLLTIALLIETFATQALVKNLAVLKDPLAQKFVVLAGDIHVVSDIDRDFSGIATEQLIPYQRESFFSLFSTIPLDCTVLVETNSPMGCYNPDQTRTDDRLSSFLDRCKSHADYAYWKAYYWYTQPPFDPKDNPNSLIHEIRNDFLRHGHSFTNTCIMRDAEPRTLFDRTAIVNLLFFTSRLSSDYYTAHYNNLPNYLYTKNYPEVCSRTVQASAHLETISTQDYLDRVDQRADQLFNDLEIIQYLYPYKDLATTFIRSICNTHRDYYQFIDASDLPYHADTLTGYLAQKITDDSSAQEFHVLNHTLVDYTLLLTDIGYLRRIINALYCDQFDVVIVIVGSLHAYALYAYLQDLGYQELLNQTRVTITYEDNQPKLDYLDQTNDALYITLKNTLGF